MPIGEPAALEIIEEDGAFLLFRNDARGICIADTWHLSLEDAKRQAAFEFDVRDDDWVPAGLTQTH